jgi:hypothetical protein
MPETLSLSADERQALRQQFGAIVGELANAGPGQTISFALLYHAPVALIEHSIDNLWRSSAQV